MFDEDEEGSVAVEGGKKKKKEKKLVFLSRSVLQKIRERPMTTGTEIATEILELYRKFSNVREVTNNISRKWTLRTCRGVYTML